MCVDVREWLNRANKKRHQLKRVKPGSDAERCLREEISELEWDIQQAIDEVADERMREVLALRYVLGMSTRQIADDLRCSSRTVRRRLEKGEAAAEKLKK